MHDGRMWSARTQNTASRGRFRRFTYPISLGCVTVTWLASSLLEVSILDPLALVLRAVLAAGVLLGAAREWKMRDPATIVASVAVTVGLGPLVFPDMLLSATLLLSLGALFLVAVPTALPAPSATRIRRAVDGLTVGLAPLALVLGSLVLAALPLAEALSSESTAVTPSPDGRLAVVEETVDQGALGSFTHFYVRERFLGVIEHRTILPDDSWGARWVDERTLAVGGARGSSADRSSRFLGVTRRPLPCRSADRDSASVRRQ